MVVEPLARRQPWALLAALALALVGLVGVMRQPQSVLLVSVDEYQHRGSWGGFLSSERAQSAPGALSNADMKLLKIAKRDIKKQHVAAQESEAKEEAALREERRAKKLAQLNRQKARAARRSRPAKAPKPLPKIAKRVGLKRNDVKLLKTAENEIKNHDAKRLAQEKEDLALDKKQQARKLKMRQRMAGNGAVVKVSGKTAKSADKPSTTSGWGWGGWGGFLPTVSLRKQVKASAAGLAADAAQLAPNTRKALKAVGVNAAALGLLASAEKSMKHDTREGDARRKRDDQAYAQMAKKAGSVFDDSNASREAKADFSTYEKEANIGLTSAAEEDRLDEREAWKK